MTPMHGPRASRGALALLRFAAVLATLCCAAGSAGAGAADEPGFAAPGYDDAGAYEMPRTRILPVVDSATGGHYELYVRLPTDYDAAADQRHPVIYTTDAVWHMEMLAGAVEYLMPDAILVGISWQTDLGADEAFASRFRDYTVVPYGDPALQARYHGGDAAQHLAFLRDDVVPLVEARYRTDPARRSYFGYSLGGVLGAYVLLEEPALFASYVLGSPALSGRSAAFLQSLAGDADGQGPARNPRVFVSIGELETSSMADARALATTLHRAVGSEPGMTELIVIEASDHGTAFPETVVRGVRWLMAQE